MKNEGLTYTEMSEKLTDMGVTMKADTIRKRVYAMMNRGVFDFVKDDTGDILSELEREFGGLFKIGVIDIETTGLWADFGYVLVAVIKNIDTGEHEVFRLDECKSYRDPNLKANPNFWRRVDRELLLKIREAYEKYDIIVHFNGRNFDIKFLNTRLIKNGIPLLPDMKQLDIYQIAKHKLRTRSKRLDALKEFFEIDTEQEGHRWEYWQMAGAGIKEGFDFVAEHFKRDVDRLASVTRIMKQYISYINK